jgi:hypothetical protein
MKKVLIVAACIAAAGLLLIGISFIIGGSGVYRGFKDSELSNYNAEANRAIVPYYVSDMELEAFTSVSIDVVNADVNIEKGDSYGIVIDYPDSRYNPSYKVQGGALTMKDDPVKTVKSFWQLFNTNFWQNGFNLKHGNVTVFLPEGEYDRIDIENVNGPILISDTTVNELKMECVNSTIDVTNVTIKEGNWNTVNGKIQAEQLTGSNLDIETVNGGISLVGTLSGDSSINTVNGSIEIGTALSRDLYHLDLSTLNGKVYLDGEDHKKGLDTGSGAANSIKAETVNGRVEINFG